MLRKVKSPRAGRRVKGLPAGQPARRRLISKKRKTRLSRIEKVDLSEVKTITRKTAAGAGAKRQGLLPKRRRKKWIIRGKRGRRDPRYSPFPAGSRLRSDRYAPEKADRQLLPVPDPGAVTPAGPGGAKPVQHAPSPPKPPLFPLNLAAALPVPVAHAAAPEAPAAVPEDAAPAADSAAAEASSDREAADRHHSPAERTSEGGEKAAAVYGETGGALHSGPGAGDPAAGTAAAGEGQAMSPEAEQASAMALSDIPVFNAPPVFELPPALDPPSVPAWQGANEYGGALEPEGWGTDPDGDFTPDPVFLEALSEPGDGPKSAPEPEWGGPGEAAGTLLNTGTISLISDWIITEDDPEEPGK